jgi:hypothetical protein
MTVASLMIDLLVHGHGHADAAPLSLMAKLKCFSIPFQT